MSDNIVIFSTFFPPHVGGVEYYSSGLAHCLSKKGYKVTVVTTTKEYVENDNYSVEVLDSIDIIRNRLPFIIPTKRNREIFKKLRLLNLSGAIVQTRFYPLSAVAVNFLKKNKIPILLIDHGTGHFKFSNKLINYIGELYEHAITRFIKNRCNSFYGVSHACCEWLDHFGITSKGVLHNAVNILEYDDIKGFDGFGVSLDGKIVISFVGRLIPEKGVEKLIKAFESIHQRNDSTILLIAGDGDLYDKYKSISNKDIVFLGRLSHENVLRLLKRSDVYCFPSDYPEGLPTTLLEAAASKTLIVTTLAGGTKDLICSEDFGGVLYNNSVEEIADCISKYVDDEIERKRLIENAYNRISNEFTWDIVSDKVIKELQLDKLLEG